MLTRRRFIKTLGTVPVIGLACSFHLPWPAGVAAAEGELQFKGGAKTVFGDWWAEGKISPASWTPGSAVKMDTFLHLSTGYIPAMVAAGFAVDQIQALVTSERCFDPDGWMRLPSDEKMSTLITPTRLAIEGGDSGAISRYTGSRHRNPVDQFKRLPLAQMQRSEHSLWVHMPFQFTLPGDLPPGIYRLRIDFGVVASKRGYSLAAEGFAQRPRQAVSISGFYSPPIPCDGTDIAGRPVDAAKLRRRIYWVLMGQYNSNGYQGVVAEDDRGRFALSDRHIIPDEVILPLYDGNGNRLSYSLEPDIRTDAIDEMRNIPWDYTRGELSVQVTDPSGNTVDLGTAPFVDKRGRIPTTKNPKFTAWKPQAYGRYRVVAKGWIADRWGNRYEGGGSYQFWIAKRMTMATATFQGIPYPVGSRYGRDIGFAPAVPAEVTVKVDLYPYSDAGKVKSLTYSGKATAGGLFGSAQGMKPFALDEPGEYHSHILANYSDSDGHLWICSMRHAGVVYPEDTPLIAHGKKLKIHGTSQLVDRGDSGFEGFIEPNDDLRNLDHIDFPYNAGDCLLIASEGQGANKINPTLTYEIKNSGQQYDPKWQPIGRTNVRIQTSNGLSPHMYPEYITDLAYFYAAGPRPGFMSRFLVGEDAVRAPYWPTSGTNFGGQFGASNNGDLPGDIYRLIGGVVLRHKDKQPLYGGYIASAFILPAGGKNNRVIAPGAEELIGPDGRKFRFFLVSIRPGMVYEQGATFAPAFQIDPILPAKIRCVLRYPDGREKAWEGTGDRYGSFAGSERVPLDRPGVYVYTVESSWEGHPGCVPGLPADGGQIYVIEKERPEGAKGLRLALKNQQSFPPDQGIMVEGFSNADKVYYAAVIPGAVVDQGVLPVDGGQFQYHFNPATVNQRIPTYDIENRRNGKKEIGDIVHLTFFAQQKAPDGSPYHAFARAIFRGTTVLYCYQ